MNFCIIITLNEKSNFENVNFFLKTLLKTSDDYSVVIINNSRIDIGKISDAKIKNIDIISNNVDVGKVVSFNQGLQYSKSNFDYSIFINPEYSVVVDKDWLSLIRKYLDDKFGIGGTVNYLKINKSEKIRKLLYSVSRNDDLSWLSANLNKYMLVEYVDRNIFVIKNSFVNFIDSKFCEEDSLSMQLSLQALLNGKKIVDIKEIYSCSEDLYRFDIVKKINDGSKIVYPIKINSVREKFMFEN